MEKINDFKYKYDDHIIEIIPINIIINYESNNEQILNISEFYLDNEFIAKIYIDFTYKETILDCEKHWTKFDYIEKFIVWLSVNNPDIFNQYANYTDCTYLKIDGYID